MKEKEPRLSFLTWKSAAIVLASVGFGAILGSGKARSRIGGELGLYYRGFRNAIRKKAKERQDAEVELKAGRVLGQVFPQGLKAEK